MTNGRDSSSILAPRDQAVTKPGPRKAPADRWLPPLSALWPGIHPDCGGVILPRALLALNAHLAPEQQLSARAHLVLITIATGHRDGNVCTITLSKIGRRIAKGGRYASPIVKQLAARGLLDILPPAEGSRCNRYDLTKLVERIGEIAANVDNRKIVLKLDEREDPFVLVDTRSSAALQFFEADGKPSHPVNCSDASDRTTLRYMLERKRPKGRGGSGPHAFEASSRHEAIGYAIEHCLGHQRSYHSKTWTVLTQGSDTIGQVVVTNRTKAKAIAGDDIYTAAFEQVAKKPRRQPSKDGDS